MTLRRILNACFLSVLVVAGCDCDSASRIAIVSPTDGSTLTVDADPAASGFQADVIISAPMLRVGETLRVYPDASVVEADPNAPTPFTATTTGSEEVVVRVTLVAGENPIIVCARDACAVKSRITRVTVSPGACSALAFTSPAAGTETTLHLGPSDDQDGSACGAEFATHVTVSAELPDGAKVDLRVNDVSAATAQAMGGVVDFGNVVLGNRGDTANALEVVVDDGSGCATEFGKPIFVDCDGSSCAITAPSPSSTFLNAANDVDTMNAGFQTNITVTSDADTAGETTKLILDSDEPNALSAVAVGGGTNSASHFNGVSLTEGAHLVQAECEDATGNITRSSVAMWTVDTIPCGVTMSEPTAGQDIGTNDDLDTGLAGIQILAKGGATGTDCTNVRVALCPAIAGGAFGTLTANAYSLQVTLGSAASQDVCAEVRDAAGNIASVQTQVDVSTTAPQLAIITPNTNSRYNRLGNPVGMAMHIADLDSGTPACDAAFTVDCQGIGQNVELVSGSTVLSTVSCVANGASMFGGRATFASVALPTGTPSFTVFARQTVAGSTGVSTPVALMADCERPTLAVTSPACGSTISSAQDTNSMLSGIQLPVTVSSPNVPQVGTVSITIIDTVGMSLSYSGMSSTPTGTDFTFPATFGSAATFDVVAQTADSFGNAANSPACQITATNLPTLAITTPAPGFVVNANNAAAVDCDAAAGVQVQVSATTNATNGSTASIQIGVGTLFATTVMGGTVSGCVDAPQGQSNIVVMLNDTVTGDGVSGAAQASSAITVDTLVPTATFSPMVTILNHRIARVQLTFTAQDDGGQPYVDYDLRCAGAVIDTEMKWTAATVINVPTAPQPGGSAELFVFGSMTDRFFRTGVRHHCVLRVSDIGGNFSPLPVSNFVIHPQFESTTIDSGTTLGARMGRGGGRVIGDVDGDLVPDVLINGIAGAFLYFGTPTLGATDSPDITFVPMVSAGSQFGAFIAGLGDFNGDGRNDFAISDYSESSNRGGVYIYFGRSRANWTALAPAGIVTVGTTGCAADLCVRGSDLAASSFFGYDIAGVGDFDADGDHDLAIGISGLNQVLVLSGRGASATPITITDNPDGFLITGPSSVPATTDFGWSVIGTGNITGTSATDLIVLAAGMDGVTFMLTHPPKLHRIAGRGRAGPGLTAIGIGPDIVEIITDRVLPAGFGQLNDRVSLGMSDFDDDGDRDLVAFESIIGGFVRVFKNDGSGGFTNAQSTELRAATSPSSDFFGANVSNAYHPTAVVGDVDRDGIEDVLAGAFGAGASTASSAGLVYGRLTPAPLIDWTNDDAAAVLSPLPLPVSPVGAPFRLTSFIGDVDGDGFEDILVTDPTADGASPSGRVFLLH